MKGVILILFIVACLSGCATASKIYTSDGKEGYNITCSGALFVGPGNWGRCYEKAGNLCESKGYVVQEKNQDNLGGPRINRNMIIKCKE